MEGASLPLRTRALRTTLAMVLPVVEGASLPLSTHALRTELALISPMKGALEKSPAAAAEPIRAESTAKMVLRRRASPHVAAT